MEQLAWCKNGPTDFRVDQRVDPLILQEAGPAKWPEFAPDWFAAFRPCTTSSNQWKFSQPAANRHRKAQDPLFHFVNWHPLARAAKLTVAMAPGIYEGRFPSMGWAYQTTGRKQRLKGARAPFRFREPNSE